MKTMLSLLLSLLLTFSPLILSVSATEVAEISAPVQAELSLPCKSAILIEQTTGKVLYEKNPDEALPIASVTKIMTLLLVMEAVKNKTVSLNDPVPISENAASMGGSQVYLEPGESITLNEVLKAVFVSSANDGAVALAEMISGSVESFVGAMNAKAQALGMSNTHFFNPTGLDDSETNLSTAHDVALMSKALLAIDGVTDYTTIWIDSIRGGNFGLSNTNKLIRFYPGATGLKTGSTGKAKYCVSASAERKGLRLCAVVLAGETSADRFQAAKTLLDYGFANFSFYVPEKLNPEPIRVWGGQKDTLAVTVGESGFLLPKTDTAEIQCEIKKETDLFAPVKAGQTVGTIEYKKGDQVLHSIPITAAEEILPLKYGDVFKKLLSLYLTGCKA
jgi:D-alanyl-D-alanine carboxypeptidase (penicillin-binding protein 5/6)